jgi:arylsulfatase A-like enzyme
MIGTAKKLFILILTSTVLACGSDDRPLNVVLIGVDTLRPDHLGAYGYERNTSPNVDALASEGVLFTNASSSSPWTLPSFATVLTSLYPAQHGATTLESGLRESVPTLAGTLKAKGYSTGAIINAPVLREEFGLDRGFDHYDAAGRDERFADDTTWDALEWIDSRSGGPFLLFVHYFDPHLAYSPPSPFDTLFCPDYRGQIGKSFDRVEARKARASDFRDLDILSQADWNRIISLYDGEIAFTDKAIGDLIRGLGERGLRERTLVVFLSDHGEEFFEHAGFAHGHSLFMELLRVPLMFSLPGVLPAGGRCADPVRLIDVAPTVLDLLGFRADPSIEGVSLKSLLLGGDRARASETSLLPPSAVYSESLLYGSEKKCLALYPWKLIYDVATGEKILFNLEQDPGERVDLVHSRPAELRSAEEMLFTTFLSTSDTWYVEMDGGGDQHTFDIRISAGQKLLGCNIYLQKFQDADGQFTSRYQTTLTSPPNPVLKAVDLQITDRLTLAFKVEPKGAPIEFDFAIDGEPALERTFMGRVLERPAHMPFIRRGGLAAAKLAGNPSSRPTPPYVLVRYHKYRYSEESAVKLTEQTKRELRAIGYIQ